MCESLWNWIGSKSRMTIDRRGWIRPMLFVVLFAVCFLVVCPEADAGPGGQFVKQMLSSRFGRIGGIIVGGLMLLACILLLPLILLVKYKESAGIRRTKQDLAVLAARYRWFQWSSIRSRVKETARKIADVWATGDLSSVASFMTPEYFASQQQLLRRWVDEGKQIVYRLEKVCRIEPLAVGVEDAATHSWIRVLVTVDCVDYMRDQYTLEVVKGEVGKTSGFESVWCFVYRDQQWLLNGIEEGSTSLTWAMAKNKVDTGYLDFVDTERRQQVAPAPRRSRSRSQAPALDAESDLPAAQPKQRLVRKPADNQDQ